MTVEDAINMFSSFTRAQQIRFLASFAHWLTILARDTYEVGADGVIAPTQLREFNEVQHRVVGHLLKLLDDTEGRYPDDVLVQIITEEGDDELLWVFENALRGS